MKKILMVCAQHGNEKLGENLLEYIDHVDPALRAHVDGVVANPKAVMEGVRFIDTDMNRSYGADSSGYECRRAELLLQIICNNNYDLVLDMHTTSCKMPPSVIASNISKNSIAQEFLLASDLKNIVLMNDSMVEKSLIGNCKTAISIEVNKDQAARKDVLHSLYLDIKNYVHQENVSKKQRDIYVVDTRILKSEYDNEDLLKMKNFKKTSSGFYPVLVGENSYAAQTDYVGFRASKMYSERI